MAEAGTCMSLMDDAVRRYRGEMDSEHRPVLDRLHQLVLTTCPEAEVVLSYGMPTYRIGRRRLNIGAWKHGLSLYVSPNRDGGFSARHPGLAKGKGTIRLRPADAAIIPDAEFQDLIRAALRPADTPGIGVDEAAAARLPWREARSLPVNRLRDGTVHDW